MIRTLKGRSMHSSKKESAKPSKKPSKVLSKVKNFFKGGKVGIAGSTPAGKKIVGIKFTKKF